MGKALLSLLFPLPQHRASQHIIPCFFRSSRETREKEKPLELRYNQLPAGTGEKPGIRWVKLGKGTRGRSGERESWYQQKGMAQGEPYQFISLSHTGFPADMPISEEERKPADLRAMLWQMEMPQMPRD